MSPEQTAFFKDLCVRMGWEPTDWRLEALAEWNRMEGMPMWTYNPLATTWPDGTTTRRDKSYNIGYGPGKWNNANAPLGVGVYATRADGVEATAKTLEQSYYPNIRECFEVQDGLMSALGEFATYVGSEAYGAALLQFMQASTADKGGGSTQVPAPETPDFAGQITSLNRAVMQRMDLFAMASHADYEVVKICHALLVKGGMLTSRD